jgi:hypothetical protein
MGKSGNVNTQLIHGFSERLAFSEGIEDGPEVLNAIANMVPNATAVRRAQEIDDRQGTDYWIDRSHNLPSLSIDVKRREFCPIVRFNSDDACIETTSVYNGDSDGRWADEHRKKIGWTLDYSKRTDFIVYTWPADNGTRFWIVPFVPLCKAARTNWRAWAARLGERPAFNQGYLTLCVYPARREIARAVSVFMKGVA